MEGLDLLLAVQRRLVRVDQRHHAAVADPLALRPLQLQQAAGVVRQDRLVPHHIAGQHRGHLHLILVGDGGGQRVAEIAHRLNREIGQHAQRDRCQQKFCAKGFLFHGYLFVSVREAFPAPCRTLCGGADLHNLQLHRRTHRRDGGGRVLEMIFCPPVLISPGTAGFARRAQGFGPQNVIPA